MTPKQIVDKMYNSDPFSHWLGINILKIEPGLCILSMTVRREMLNGFSIAHGGISYSLADSALAFASNSYGFMAVSIETSITHTAQVKENDILTAQTEEVHKGKRTALYYISITNQHNEKVAYFKGTVYITDKKWQ